MRWKYPDKNDHQEEAARTQVRLSIKNWWDAFELQEAAICALFSQKQEWDLPAWIHENLHAIDPNLMWEFGPGLLGGHRLIITPEADRHLRPLVNEILSCAPTIPGWEFYGYRLPEDVEEAKQAVQARTKGDISRTSFKAAIGELNRIDLTFFSPSCKGPADQSARNDCFVAVETLLGEEVLDKWVGCIEVKSKSWWKDRDTQSLDKLLPAVKKLISEIIKGLPERTCLDIHETAQWTLFKLKPTNADDYPSQLDMFVGATMSEKVWHCAHRGGSFDSIRFSKHDETFAYLKIDGTEGFDQEKFADRAQIEDALNDILIPQRFGSVIGGGTGLKYSYIDLAFLDVKHGISAIKDCLREGNIPKRTWLLFFDSDLQDEWVGIWDDTPKPPMRNP